MDTCTMLELYLHMFFRSNLNKISVLFTKNQPTMLESSTRKHLNYWYTFLEQFSIQMGGGGGRTHTYHFVLMHTGVVFCECKSKM